MVIPLCQGITLSSKGGRCVRFLEVELALLGTPAGEVLRLACLPRPLLDGRKACEPGLAAPPALSIL